MLSLKPVFLWKYLKLEPNHVPSNIKSMHYLSYEDALWDILAKKNIPDGSTILVPEFYCGDVENNMRVRGYNVTYYRVTRQLLADERDFINQIKKTKPYVCVVFHSVGITNRLIKSRRWLKFLPKNIIIIEDSVHRIVDPSDIKLFHPNHLVIDSLRKVVPMQGSVVYGNPDFLNFSLPPFSQEIIYRTLVFLLWISMNIYWGLTQLHHGSYRAVRYAKRADMLMKIGYDLIGDCPLPSRGILITKLLLPHLDITNVKKIKDEQIRYYESHVGNLNQKIFTRLSYQKSERGLMYAYPLVLSLKYADRVLRLFRQKGIMLNLELNDSVWSKRHKIIYLPIGPFLTQSDLSMVIKVLHKVNKILT